MLDSKVLQINDNHLALIKSVLAYPVVQNVQLSDDEVKLYAISPAMYHYFLKFPIPVYEQTVQETNEMEISFPDDDTIGVLDVRTVGKTGFGQRQGNSSDFWQVVRFNQQFTGNRLRSLNYRGNNMFNPNGLRYNFIAERQMIDAMTNNLETFRHIVNYSKKSISVYSSVVAQLLIVWAKTSNNFNDIKPTQLLNVIKLSQAYLLRHLSYLGSMLNDNTSEKQINIDALNTNAERLETEVYDLWREFPDIVTLRVS